MLTTIQFHNDSNDLEALLLTRDRTVELQSQIINTRAAENMHLKIVDRGAAAHAVRPQS